MIYLLDTHTFLWFINDDDSLSPTAKALITDPENILYLSIASLWEIAIKVSLGKLEVPSPFSEFMLEQLHKNTIVLSDIKPEYTGTLITLPFHHRDPFDRLIIAQSLNEDIPVIGRDEIFDRYGVQRRW